MTPPESFSKWFYNKFWLINILAYIWGCQILILAILVKWYLIVVLLFISLMTNNVEHFFMCLFMSLVKYLLLKPFVHLLLLDCLLSYCWLLRVFPIFWIEVFHQLCDFSLCGLSFHSLNSVFLGTEVLNFEEVQLISFFLLLVELWLLYLKNIFLNQSCKDFILCFVLKV